MRVFRLQKATYGKDISGNGSNLVAGRWHIVSSLRLLYTAENKSLALLEKVQSFTSSPDVAMPAFNLLELELPDKKVKRKTAAQLPKGWENANRKISQAFGMHWLTKGESLALAVPSVISGDFNVLINPQHPDFNQVKVVQVMYDFKLDARLIR